jgi:AAA family ATP:ADP antiporter
MRADPLLHRAFHRAIDVRPDEVRALVWSWLYIFSVMCSYAILRPIRDDAGVAGGVENLPWLFTGTLIGMLLVNPPFAALVARLPRGRFIAIAYRFFALNLLVFAVLLKLATAQQNIWVGRAFYIWTSVFNLFVVSVFWAVMVDVFTAEQGKRLFGFVAAGATLGGIVGAGITALLARHVPHVYLLIGSALLLELAVFSVGRLSRVSESLLHLHASAEEQRVGGGVFAGLTRALSSPYLLNISLFILLYSITSTLLYFQQAAIVGAHFTDRAARTSFFGWIDFSVQSATLAVQLFLSGRIIRAAGVALTLALLPALSILGFGALAMAPTLAVLVGVLVIRRAGNYALAKPARETLFTVVPRQDKYKAKSFIDTVVYRTGDQVGAWTSALLTWLKLGTGMTSVALIAIPLSILWLVNALWLGRRQEALAAPSLSASAADDLSLRRGWTGSPASSR